MYAPDGWQFHIIKTDLNIFYRYLLKNKLLKNIIELWPCTHIFQQQPSSICSSSYRQTSQLNTKILSYSRKYWGFQKYQKKDFRNYSKIVQYNKCSVAMECWFIIGEGEMKQHILEKNLSGVKQLQIATHCNFPLYTNDN